MTRRLARKIATVVLSALILGGVPYLINHFLQEKYRKITVGRDTTFVTGPSFADGRIDFLSAVNGRLSAGVTTENNAAVPLYLANPQTYWINWKQQAFLHALGIEAPRKEDAYIDFPSFMFERQVKAATRPQQVRNIEGELKSQWYDEANRLATTRWTRQSSPDGAAWLDRNQPAIALVLEATRREQYWFPLIGRPDLGTTREAQLMGSRDLSRLLAIHTMLALGSHDFPAWQEGVLAQYRLGRLLMHASTPIQCFEAFAVIAQADTEIEDSLGQLSPQEARSLLTGLRALPPIRSVAECDDQYVRLETIADLSIIAHFGPMAEGISSSDPTVPLPAPASFGFQPPIYFDDLLREYNRFFDRRVAIERETSFARRSAALAAFESDRQAVLAESKGSSSTAAIRRLTMFAVAMPSATSVEDRTRQKSRLIELALQMYIYRGEHGQYPAKLADLGQVGRAADDWFAEGAPVHFAPAPAMIYSVGPNLQDDHGANERPREMRSFSAIMSGTPVPPSNDPDDITVTLP